MSQKFIKVYKKFDIKNIKEHLLIYGDLSGSCANCQAIDLKLDDLKCPKCKTAFNFIAFRNVKSHLPKIQKLIEERPGLEIVDHEDFQRNLKVVKAEDFMK